MRRRNAGRFGRSQCRVSAGPPPFWRERVTDLPIDRCRKYGRGVQSPRGATHTQPYVKVLVTMVNSIYNGYRMEDVWLDK